MGQGVDQHRDQCRETDRRSFGREHKDGQDQRYERREVSKHTYTLISMILRIRKKPIVCMVKASAIRKCPIGSENSGFMNCGLAIDMNNTMPGGSAIRIIMVSRPWAV